MDFLSAKALTIAVGISVSLAITSAVLFTLSQITLIYKDVYNTDISIKKQFAEYAMYDNTIMTGLEMYNTAKKYNGNTKVNVLLRGNNINTDVWVNTYDTNNGNEISKLYDVTFTTTANEVVNIFFKVR